MIQHLLVMSGGAFRLPMTFGSLKKRLQGDDLYFLLLSIDMSLLQIHDALGTTEIQ